MRAALARSKGWHRANDRTVVPADVAGPETTRSDGRVANDSTARIAEAVAEADICGFPSTTSRTGETDAVAEAVASIAEG